MPSNNVVKFNGAAATVTAGTSTSLDVIVPAGATNGLITIAVGGTVSQSNTAFVMPPRIFSFLPTSGIPGDEITINGGNFDPDQMQTGTNRVTLNGQEVVVTHSTATSLSLYIPWNTTSGLFSITVNGFTTTSTTVFVVKQPQQINFGDVASNSITMGDLPLLLVATASSGLPVEFSGTSGKLSIVNNEATWLAPGIVTITANQSGNDQYAEATPVSITFCVNPKKPRITVENSDDGVPNLISTSSIGNQWYFNGDAIAGGTSSSLAVTETGLYSVKVTVDNCVSHISDDFSLAITGLQDEYSRTISVYPVPAHQILSIGLRHYDNVRQVDILIYNTMSQLVACKTTTVHDQHVDLDISTLPQGVYIMQAGQGNKKQQIKFVKED